ncbi:MAG: DNA recombination protein RmuC [Candidatus Pacebacteria bacterium]|nr:DNA recombination protein RmuC [Candidatus Paceibacterota bacterium]MBP9832001.1 DNA recombination protein RmuC [Candidatus Paceibacterota bacterium]
METLLIVLVVALLILNAGAVVFFLSRKKDTGQGEGVTMINQRIAELSRTLDERLDKTSENLMRSTQAQSTEANRIIRDVTERLTKLDETNRQVVSFADQLQNLQDILKNPKQRGILGEYYLETLLKNVLPPGQYQMQYAFANGEIVDAAVFVKDKVIPIDSKFSLENYNRLTEATDPSEKLRLEKLFVNDLKLRIQETAKYIRPSEGTMDFAFMFIPHEAIYYDLLINKIGAVTEDTENLIQRAAGRYKVIIVSPTSFLAYLQTVLQGLRAMQIEEQAKDIVQRVGELGKHLKTFEEYHAKLGNALGTVVNHFNNSGKEFKKIDKDVMRITGDAPGIAMPVIDAPTRDED